MRLLITISADSSNVRWAPFADVTSRLGSLDAPSHDRDTCVVGSGDERLAIQDERPPGVYRERRSTGSPHGSHGRDAHDGHIEPHILPGLRHLDDSRPRSRQPPSPRDHFVGPFHRFNRNNSLILDCDGLTNIATGYRVSGVIAERQIVQLVSAW